MLVKQKRYASLASSYASRFTKAWDYFCCASDAFLNGYQQGCKDTLDGVDGNSVIEREYLNGEHQLTVETFDKFQKDILDKPFKEVLANQLPHFEFKDLRVSTDKDGIVSFQGTAKKFL